MTPERQKELDRIYNQSRREYFREYHKGWYKRNRDNALKAVKKWQKKNPEKLKEYRDNFAAKMRKLKDAD